MTTNEKAKKNPAITPTQTAPARRTQEPKDIDIIHPSRGGFGPRPFISRPAHTYLVSPIG